jgi:hypothetical protein
MEEDGDVVMVVMVDLVVDGSEVLEVLVVLVVVDLEVSKEDPLELTVHQQRYRHSNSNKNVDIKFSAHDTFLEHAYFTCNV